MRGAVFAAAIAFGALPAGAAAQATPPDSVPRRSHVRGWVRDSTRQPVASAWIAPRLIPVRATTDDSGYFYLAPLPAGPLEIEVRRLGYKPETFAVTVPDSGGVAVEIHVRAAPLVLAGVDVSRRAFADLSATGFYRRRARSIGGTFYTPEEIEQRHAAYASDFLVQTPGVQPVGRAGHKRVVLTTSNCDVAIFVDGTFVRSGRDLRGVDWGVFDDLVSVADIYAMEVYRRAPSEFQASFLSGQADCGAVVIWTRLYRETGRRPDD